AELALTNISATPTGTGFTYKYNVSVLGMTELDPAGGPPGGSVTNPGNWFVLYAVPGLTPSTVVTATGGIFPASWMFEITSTGGFGVTPPTEVDHSQPGMFNLVGRFTGFPMPGMEVESLPPFTSVLQFDFFSEFGPSSSGDALIYSTATQRDDPTNPAADEGVANNTGMTGGPSLTDATPVPPTWVLLLTAAPMALFARRRGKRTA